MGSFLSTSNGNDFVHSIECFFDCSCLKKEGEKNPLFLQILAATSKIGIVLTLEGISEIVQLLLFKVNSPK